LLHSFLVFNHRVQISTFNRPTFMWHASPGCISLPRSSAAAAPTRVLYQTATGEIASRYFWVSRWMMDDRFHFHLLFCKTRFQYTLIFLFSFLCISDALWIAIGCVWCCLEDPCLSPIPLSYWYLQLSAGKLVPVDIESMHPNVWWTHWCQSNNLGLMVCVYLGSFLIIAG